MQSICGSTQIKTIKILQRNNTFCSSCQPSSVCHAKPLSD
ncbi:hypothetical protein KAR91_08830 [Candidatus Pacearchaeota archaeon]|nr:hypothetical protein [Candidatus Pacearchaeota archaeon]